jgi:type I protein arginine methyltransferase
MKRRFAYQSEQVWFPLAEGILDWENDFHDLMLGDRLRMKAYEKAIKQVVRPGMTVLDLGTGTGILSKWALEAGAKMVYGVDVDKKNSKKAVELIRKIEFLNRFRLFNGSSYDITLPERVDVIVSEILGNLADNEDMTPILFNARKRFLKKNGVMLPKGAETWLVPITSKKSHKQVAELDVKSIASVYNLKKLSSTLKINNPFNLCYDAILPKKLYLAPPLRFNKFSFNGTDKATYAITKKFTANHSGIFTGFKGYFVAQLSSGVTIDISGEDIKNHKTSDCWKHAYLPIEHPIDVFKGDIIELIFSRAYTLKKSWPFRQIYSWNGKIIRKKKIIATFNQSTGLQK